MTPIPPYLSGTFLVHRSGFHFTTPPPPDLADETHLQSPDPWVVLGCVLARAHRGEFDGIAVLPSLLRVHEDAVLWPCVADLVAAAGTADLISQFVTEYSPRFGDPGVQTHLARMLTAGGLSAVPHMLALLRVATHWQQRDSIESALSFLLEPAHGPIWSGPAEIVEPDEDYPAFLHREVSYDHDGYEHLVETRVEQIRTTGVTDHAIIGGAPIDLTRLASDLLRSLRAGGMRDRIEWELGTFQALTGVAFTPVESTRCDFPPDVATVVAAFLESGQASMFQPGTRYFFGHPL